MNRLHLVFFGLAVAVTAGAAEPPEVVVIDTRAKGAPFPHFWERMFGSGRAILSLRESHREDLRVMKGASELRYLRFHDILDDDTGLVVGDRAGPIRYNFTLMDEIYDGLLENGVHPFVELSFMPRALAANLRPYPFWYKPIPSPPKDYDQWADLVRAFTEHMVGRNGLPEVNQWYFEVWNEPNLGFWTGEPKQETYFKLYDAAARAVKAVAPTLRVGGPATARVRYLDANRGSAVGAWSRMGSPDYPTREEREKLQNAAELSAASAIELDRGALRLTLPVHGLALVEIPGGSARQTW